MPKAYLFYISLVLLCCYVKPDWIKRGKKTLSSSAAQLTWKNHKYRLLTNVPPHFSHHTIQACYIHDNYIVMPDLIRHRGIWFFLRNGAYSHFIKYPVKHCSAFKWRPDIPGFWVADSLSQRWQLRDLEGELVEEGKMKNEYFGMQQSNPVLQEAGTFFVSPDNQLIQVLPNGERKIVLTGYAGHVLKKSILSPKWTLIPHKDTLLHAFENESKKIYNINISSSERMYHFNDRFPKFSQEDKWFTIVSPEDFRFLKLKNESCRFDHLPHEVLPDQLLLVERKL